jgi:hypothetical protein
MTDSSDIIQAARNELAMWEARLTEDLAGLRTAEYMAATLRDRVAKTQWVCESLRTALKRCDDLVPAP